jgi:Flp pilus assembly protein TadD
MARGVKYLGDKACVECHDGKVTSYHHHPMGRSMAEPAAVARKDFGPDMLRSSFESGGSRFQVERRGRRVFHEEVYCSQGKEIADLRSEVRLVVGSGNQGRSYLIERDGFLFQSPISWYSRKEEEAHASSGRAAVQHWDISPGYAGNLMHFNRPIGKACLFCHSNSVRAAEDTVNRYRPPVFSGQASIGCERCHGPGELHVRFHKAGKKAGEIDRTIVNPGKLEPALRDAVCQQCHLRGEVRVVRRGKDIFDFRPGMPLQEVLSVFVLPPGPADRLKSVSHVEQMRVSRCFRESKPDHKLGCISCHDPHSQPRQSARVAFYRKRCLACHQDKGCSVAPAERRKKQPQDSCIACHMPPTDSKDVVHAAVTDHRVLRSPDQELDQVPDMQSEGLPLVHFHRDQQLGDDEEQTRDLGMALIKYVQEATVMDEKQRQHVLGLGLSYLAGSLERAPNDVPAREAVAYTLLQQQRPEEAMQTLAPVLRKSPRRERALFYAVQALMAQDKKEEALSHCRRLLKVNPYFPHYHLALAQLLADKRQWDAAVKACRQALKLDPALLAARVILITSYVHRGQKDKARAEFAVVEALKPPDPDNLRRWFREQMQGRED